MRTCVICRPAVPGYLKSRPRYLTPNGGWTYDLRKARRFEGYNAAAQELTRRANAEWWLRNHTIEVVDHQNPECGVRSAE